MQPNEKLKDSNRLSVGNSVYLPPEEEEIEVSLFGPGYGESVLLHIGANKWIIVDSCIDPVSEVPAPISYLRKININPGEAVEQVIATHWHDDHIRGLSIILKECEQAEFVCSVAQTSKEFLTLVSAYGNRPMMESTGVNEFYEILKILQQRNIPPKFAIADRLLWQIDPQHREANQPSEIYALSPSDASVLLAKIDISKLSPEVGETKRRIPTLLPNHSSVALLLKIGEDSILLGADLQETGNTGTGWMAIINSGNRPSGKASFFKIPHHGSVTSNNPQIWSELIEPKPISALTPFINGNIFLPTRDDVDRICNVTDKAFSTSILKYPKFKNRPKMVEKQLREMGIKIRQAYLSPGQIRARGRYVDKKINWTVQLLGGAVNLREIYQ
jgi:beta-lactamase superfamily II metal-dependent hydrolase